MRSRPDSAIRSLVSAAADRFSKHSGEAAKPDAAARIRHPGSKRAFRDIRVPKLLTYERNVKKILFACARQLREHMAESGPDRTPCPAAALFHIRVPKYSVFVNNNTGLYMKTGRGGNAG